MAEPLVRVALVTGEPIGVEPCRRVNVTVPASTVPVVEVTAADSVTLWTLALKVAVAAEAAVVVGSGKPRPLREMAWVLPSVDDALRLLSTRESEPESTPTASGVKLTGRVQAAPAGRA
jgi:hypothetical protein